MSFLVTTLHALCAIRLGQESTGASPTLGRQP
jgi:hypothetical protein